MLKKRLTGIGLPAYLGGGSLTWEYIDERTASPLSPSAKALLKEVIGTEAEGPLEKLARRPNEMRGLTLWWMETGNGQETGFYEPIFNSGRQSFSFMATHEFAEVRIAVNELLEAGWLTGEDVDGFREVYRLAKPDVG